MVIRWNEQSNFVNMEFIRIGVVYAKKNIITDQK